MSDSMSKEGPAENAALPGRRIAQRIDSNFGMVAPFGGQGDGRNDKTIPQKPLTPPASNEYST